MELNKIVERAINLYSQSKYDEALAIYKSVICKSFPPPVFSVLYYNMGLCNYALSKFKASENNFKKSMEFGGECGYDLFLSVINQGNIVEARDWWIYRSLGARKSFPDLPIKRLKVGEIRGKNLLVLNEQGFGDEFMFSRIIQTLSAECISISYQVYEETLPVFQNYLKFDNISYFTDRNLSKNFVDLHDGFCLSGDFFFDLIDNSYGLGLVQNEVKRWDIGLCWSTNIESKNSGLRSIDPALILSELQGKTKVSLQKDKTYEDLDSVNIKSFMDTLEIIQNCREVWTVDTSVAHIAILSGAKVKLLYKDYLDWRWKIPIYKGHNLKKIN